MEVILDSLPLNIEDNNLKEVDSVSSQTNLNDSDNDNVEISLKSRKYVIDSDSDSENVGSVVNQPAEDTKKSRKYFSSDSEDEIEPVTVHNKSFPDEESLKQNIVYTTNAKGELIPENASTHKSTQQILSSLCDPETSSDEEITNTEKEKSFEPIIYKKAKTKTKKEKDEGSKKMNAREAAKQRLEIQSESQRMVRESNISLPYHKPKSYTIKEFLEKRSKLATPKIPKAPPSLAIKMTKTQLAEISKTMDERIKQVTEFYKSDESEDEDEKTENNEEISKDIRSWLDLLVDNAINSVEKIDQEENMEENAEPMEIETSLENVKEIENDIAKKKSVAELLKDQLSDIQPKLSGGPDEIIDLESGIVRPNEVKKLVDKFFQHSMKRAPLTQETKLKIMEVTSGGEIVEEQITTKLDEEEKRCAIEIPGAKLNKLRVELQKQITEKRMEMWKQKQEQGECVITTTTKDIYAEEREQCTEYDILDDEDEEEMEITDSEIEDEEEFESEIKEKKKKPPKSAFIDEEADESGNDEENDEIDDDNDEFQADDESESDENEEKPIKEKVLKRIIKPADDDDDSDDDNNDNNKENIEEITEISNDIISATENQKTPQKLEPEKMKANFDFLTPVSYLTGLQNTNSATKLKDTSPAVSPFALPADPSPFKDSNWSKNLQKKLFTETINELSQPTAKDLEAICSGTFPETQYIEKQPTPDKIIEEKVVEQKENEEEPSTQDLLQLCTSTFTSTELSKDQNETETNTNNEIKTVDNDDDQIISQLIDEDELERFRKKFDSPTIIAKNKEIIELENVNEVNATGLINSDDENDQLEVTTVKKKQKKLVFSDDEEEDNEENDINDSENDEIEENGENEEVEYDSEENEVTTTEVKEKIRIADFLENEAELSESDWDSADEDERGLDKYEVEEGDKVVYDADEVRENLERIHMRRILDEDQRDVKLLQELLLEDGELHGSGRQRQFRWKNIDDMTNDDDNQQQLNEEDPYFDDDDNEQNFRIMRMKRETFLKKHSSQNDDIDSILTKSEILKFGSEVLKRSQSITEKSTINTTATKTTTVKANNNVINVKQSFSLNSKRGSFLSRNDQVLQRLAEYNKVSSGTTTVAGATGVKNSRGFVFQTIDRTETSDSVLAAASSKRKAVDINTPNAIKKLRLDNPSPGNSKQQQPKKKNFFTKLF